MPYHYDFGDLATDDVPPASVFDTSAITFEGSLHVETIIVSTSPAASLFVGALGPADELGLQDAGTVTVTSHPEAFAAPAEGTIALKHSAGKSVLFCQLSGDFADEDARAIAQQILDVGGEEVAKVLVLSTEIVQKFLSTSDTPPAPFLRKVQTTVVGDADACPLLEMPNAVTGIPAAVLGECRARGVECAVFVSYSAHSPHQQMSMEEVTVYTLSLQAAEQLALTLDETKVKASCARSNSRPSDSLLYM